LKFRLCRFGQEYMKTSVAERVAGNEKRYRDFNKRFVDSIWVIDADSLEILFVSDSTEKVRGYKPKEVIGTHIKEMMTGTSYRKAIVTLERARKEYKQGLDPAYRLELECYNKGEGTVWIEITARFVKEEAEPLQIIGISRDITDRKISELNKDHLLKMLKESLAEEKRLRSEVGLYQKLLPICSGCRRIRDGNDAWWPLEEYVKKKTGARITHTVCPDCAKIYYPDIEEES
jgi:PAS domain S-box-containing protein